MQAATLSVKLKYLDQWNARRQAIAIAYSQALADLPIQLPQTPAWAEAIWHLFVVRSPDRDALQAHLKNEGVQTLIHYPVPPHLQQAYQDINMTAGSLPIAERYAQELLSLPMGPHLSMSDVDQVIASIQRFYRGKAS